ncbi:MAG: hypothetical protein K0U76_13920 [Actinomycetia bacterium]|nr:hypothetical protein [Actinomycetes bacterium]MCH9702447.1 hypothetical protein [Actinomycetes bacterium]MCH9733351.1 hypothetical protein [Actinomycetes bacterium]
MRELVFLDTECTGLQFDAEIWELAAIRRHADGSQSRLHLFVEHDTAKAHRLPEPFHSDYDARCPVDPGDLVPQPEAVRKIMEFIGNDAIVVGAVPAYDSQRLAVLFDRHHMRTPCWLYTVVDVCALAAGRLRAQGEPIEFPVCIDRVAHRLGIDPRRYSRHTALGDALFVEAIFDRCVGLAQPAGMSAGPEAVLAG